jgi:hypothetical protein
MSVTCPKCGKEIVDADSNSATDMAVCRACNELFSPRRGLRVNPPVPVVDLPPVTPRGATCEELPNGFDVVATVRHPRVWLAVPGLVFLLFIFTVSLLADFRGIVSTYATGWLVFWAVATAVALLLIAFLLFGKSRVSVDGGQCTVFTGLGRVGFRKRFPWSDVGSVELQKWFLGDCFCLGPSIVPTERITILDRHGRRLAKCCLMMTYKRRRFVHRELCRLLAERDAAM